MSQNSDILGMGLIGSGFMARTYAECLARHVRGAELRSVAIGSRASQLARDYVVDFDSDLEAILKRHDIDAVIIATPETIHPQQAIAAARAGKHALVEKPLAPSLAQCDAVIEAFQQSEGRLMQVKHWRFRGVPHRAMELLQNGELGKVLQIHNRTLVPLELSRAGVKRKPFYLDPAGGGLFMGWCSHNFDFVRWLAGSEARCIFASVASHGNHSIPELSTQAQIEFASGATAQIWVSAELEGPPFAQSQFRSQVVCQRGTLDLDGVGQLRIGRKGNWEVVWEQPAFSIQDPLDPVRLEGFAAMVQEFVDAIREDREPSVTGSDGRAAVELCLAARKSAADQAAVEFPLVLDD